MNKYKLKLSTEFSDMFYLSLLPFKNLSSSYINLIHAKVYYFLDIATYFPYSFPKFHSPEEITDTRKIIIDKRFIIFYKVSGDVINVVYFVDGRRSYDNMFTY